MIITSVGKDKQITSSDITSALGYTPQNAATAITTSNISSQSVNYATSAGSATSAGTLSSALSTSLGGVPTGGNAAQVLTKNSATDYDAIWSTISSGEPSFLSGATISDNYMWVTFPCAITKAIIMGVFGGKSTLFAIVSVGDTTRAIINSSSADASYNSSTYQFKVNTQGATTVSFCYALYW